MNLRLLRKKVDLIDAHMLKLLNSRAKVVSRIGKVKKRLKASIYVPDREKDVYKNIANKNKGPLSNQSLRAIFREIMSSALNLERELKIAYFGPEFTFTHIASMKKFGSSVSYASCGAISDVFSDVQKGRADYGVVPIENSIEGAVNHTLDMFIDSDLKICSEIYLEISHSLLSMESARDRIKRIYSNPMVFGQCRIWLESNLPRAELIEVSSTSKAAEIAAGLKGSACIASGLAAKKYGLKTLSSSIEDSSNNVTRFLVIGKTHARPTKEDKTSIMFSVKDSSGALHDMLVPFKKYGINLTKIESRPSRVRPWEYYFFVDLEGHCLDSKVQKALIELKKVASYMKILGSYPVEENESSE
ncbi:MAG: prephenate dehydratase [Candidatus Omnitrophota bacterium]|nr:prephenate dehydratase [Candidatus Omnitrophota bacterium]